jgi:hypothetical protein
MQPRTYVLSLLVVALAVISSIAGANLLLDPQGVFGTGFVHRSVNANYRYLRYAAYEANSAHYDGLLLGSSRARMFGLGELSRRTGAHFANFSVARGTIVDDLAVLDFVVRDKAAKHEHLRTVFLLLDMDIFGMSSFVNAPIQFQQPPPVAGGDWARFWWRNLTAFQYRNWRDTLRYARMAELEPPPIADPLADRPDAPESVGADRFPDAAQPLIQVETLVGGGPPSNWITARPDYRAHVGLFTRIVSLCREHGVRLIVATAPLNPVTIVQYDLADLDQVLSDISRIEPVWDFTTAGQLADGMGLWADEIHFDPRVANVMLDRLFGDPVPPRWRDFGRLRAP